MSEEMGSCTTTDEGSDVEWEIRESELRSLRPLSALASESAEVPTSAGAVSEDLYSGLFYEADDERWDGWASELERQMARPSATEEESTERAFNDQDGGLQNWEYISPFAEVDVKFDDVDSTLYGRYLEESKQMLLRVRDDIRTARLTASHRSSTRTASHDGRAFTRLEAVRTFLPESLMEKLAAGCSQLLHQTLPLSGQQKTPSTEAASNLCSRNIWEYYLARFICKLR